MKLQVSSIVKTTSRSMPIRGFTLVELVITIAIMSIALLGVAYSLQFSVQHSADPLWQSKTIKLVQAYADEILTKRYDEKTPIGGVPACIACSLASEFGLFDGQVRGSGSNSFNDVDDYHGLNDKPPIDAAGNVRSEYANYQVEVDVSYVGSDLGLSNNNFAKKIEITVTPPGQQALVFSVYRGNY